MADGDASLRFEFKNTKPVDLMDLTGALAAFGDAYQDHVVSAGFDDERGNVRLFVRDIRTGSVIADLVSQAEQTSLILKHIEVAAGFLTHFNEIVQFFLGVARAQAPEPTKKEAEQAMKVLEPVAKDFGSNLFLQVNNGDVHVHTYNYNAQQANAVQNAARRFLGPRIPVSSIKQDQLLRLFQVRGDPAAKVGDKGIVEELTSSPVKLTFASEEVKQKILDAAFPFQKIFLVDLEAKGSEGKLALYRILTVRDVFDRP